MMPVDRQYTKLEAAYIITADLQDGEMRSANSYAKQFGWDHKRVQRFLATCDIVNLGNPADAQEQVNDVEELSTVTPNDRPKMLSNVNAQEPPKSRPADAQEQANDFNRLLTATPEVRPTDAQESPNVFNKEEDTRKELCQSSSPKDLFNRWNQKFTGTVIKFGPDRQKKCSARLKERSLEEWDAIFERIASIFAGRGTDEWVPDFDWIIKNAANSDKILEGKFDWIAANKQPASDSRYSEIFAGA
jgi:hypothetical protein